MATIVYEISADRYRHFREGLDLTMSILEAERKRNKSIAEYNEKVLLLKEHLSGSICKK